MITVNELVDDLCALIEDKYGWMDGHYVYSDDDYNPNGECYVNEFANIRVYMSDGNMDADVMLFNDDRIRFYIKGEQAQRIRLAFDRANNIADAHSQQQVALQALSDAIVNGRGIKRAPKD